MRRRDSACLWLTLVLLAGCAGNPAPPAGQVAEDPRAAACRAEAQADPAARAEMRELNPNNPQNIARVRADAAVRVDQVFRDCLRRAGLSTGGGVEAVRRQR